MNTAIRCEIVIYNKKLIFDSTARGLEIGEMKYESSEDGILVYDKILDVKSDQVICQFSTNTSTLIPALKILGIQYNTYFDNRDVVESQNNIAFYWNPSKLAAFYNRYSTDGIDIEKREKVLRSAVHFLTSTENMHKDFLPEERLEKINQKCKLLGFYEGFPIFDAGFGMPQLLSRLGIHIGKESVLISTPIDRYQVDVFALSEKIQQKIASIGFKKKNRVRFEKTTELLKELGVQK